MSRLDPRTKGNFQSPISPRTYGQVGVWDVFQDASRMPALRHTDAWRQMSASEIASASRASGKRCEKEKKRERISVEEEFGFARHMANRY